MSRSTAGFDVLGATISGRGSAQMARLSLGVSGRPSRSARTDRAMASTRLLKPERI